MTATHDEETPLLAAERERANQKPKRTPLPKLQLLIILVLQLAEPLTSQVINPFAPQLVREIGVTHGDETSVGYYVGLLHSLFFATQALTVLHWSRASDFLGRKPIILTGLFGLSLSMYCFGLSTSFWALVFSRSLNGALNGNIGVIKSLMAEITDTTNIAQAYGYMPIAWSLGGTLGPIIGGSLSHPVERFPSLFGGSEFLKQYPYFLPCAVPATFSALAWFITYVFLKETVASPMSIKSLLGMRTSQANLALQGVASQEPNVSAVPVSEAEATEIYKEKPYPLRKLLIPRVLVAAGNYAMLSLVDITLRAILPVFYATPVRFGGLGLEPSQIGTILSVYGVANGILQIFFFAPILQRWGAKNVFIAGLVSVVPVFALFPVVNALARVNHGMSPLVWTMVFVQIGMSILINLSYGSIFIFISASSPNRASLGATNGLAQMMVSIMRTIGPSVANSFFSVSVKHRLLGGNLVYVVLIFLNGLAIATGTFLPKELWKANA